MARTNKPIYCPFCYDRKIALRTADGIKGRVATLECSTCDKTWAQELIPEVLEHLWQRWATTNSPQR